MPKPIWVISWMDWEGRAFEFRTCKHIVVIKFFNRSQEKSSFDLSHLKLLLHRCLYDLALCVLYVAIAIIFWITEEVIVLACDFFLFFIFWMYTVLEHSAYMCCKNLFVHAEPREGLMSSTLLLFTLFNWEKSLSEHRVIVVNRTPCGTLISVPTAAGLQACMWPCLTKLNYKITLSPSLLYLQEYMEGKLYSKMITHCLWRAKTYIFYAFRTRTSQTKKLLCSHA